MRGGVDKGLCLLALLFVYTYAEDAVSSEDLKTGLPEEDSKSAALAQNSESDSLETDDEPLKGSKSAASAGAYANGGQASAQAIAQSGLRENSQRPGLISPGLGSNSALAEAIAQASGGLNGLQPLPYKPGYDLSPYGLSAQAQAEAQAGANSGIGGGGPIGPSYGPGNSYPLTSGSSSAQAKAEAQAIANNAGGGGGGLYPGLNYLQGSGMSSAQAQAEAQATSNAAGYGQLINPYKPGYLQPYQPVYPGGQGSTAMAQAQAQAEALSQVSGGNLVGPSHPGYQYPLPVAPGIKSPSAQADAQAISGGYGYGSETNAQAHANANAQSSAMAAADAYSRVIPRHEYIMPHLIPGAEGTIICTREGELHYFWSSAYQCMVCTCIRNLGTLSPVCARCDGCMTPAPGPVPVPIPEPIPYPVTVAPIPPPMPPVPQVTCSPLPSGQPFQNPLNPCQICICRETVNWQGEPDVRIDCQQNPECVIPPDVTTLPPLPDVPVPIPLPICDKFPSNVFFPHPTDGCKVCKCIVEPIGLGIMEPKIVCMTLPECVPRPLPPLPTPPPEPITLPPMPVPVPPEPIPWPPVTPAPIPGPTPAPHPGSGPLPGPAPHESCRPFPPNTPFQHPWDDCQVCVCTEAYSYGRITIEVNCFTKKSCCYEPPYPEPVTDGAHSTGGSPRPPYNGDAGSIFDLTDSDTYSPRAIRSTINMVEHVSRAPSTGSDLNQIGVSQEDAGPSTSAADPTLSTNFQNTSIIPTDILEILGESKKKPEVFGPGIQEEISKRWGRILCEGLNKDQKKELMEKILVPENFQYVKAPKLNPEIAAVLIESTRNRDKRLEKAQNHLGLGIASLTNLIALLIEKDMNKLEIIKCLSEANQIFLDLHFENTLNRRKLITYSLDKKFLDIVQDVQRDSMLFGENLSEKIKASKSAEKSGLQIKKTNEASTSRRTISQQGNWRGPPRQAQRGNKRGGAKSRPTYQPTRRPALTTSASDRYQDQSRTRQKPPNKTR